MTTKGSRDCGGTWPEPMGQVVCAIKSRPGEMEPIGSQKTVSDIELYPVRSGFDLIDCVLIFFLSE